MIGSGLHATAVVRHAARQDRPLAQMEAAAPLVEEAVAALSQFRYPLARGQWGILEIEDAPRPAFSETHAYFPLSFRARITTPGTAP